MPEELIHPGQAPESATPPTAEWLVAAVAAAAAVGFAESGTAAYSASHTCFVWAIILMLVAATVWFLYLFFQRMENGEDIVRVLLHSDTAWLEHVPHICAFLAALGSVVTIAGYFLVLLR